MPPSQMPLPMELAKPEAKAGRLSLIVDRDFYSVFVVYPDRSSLFDSMNVFQLSFFFTIIVIPFM